MLIFICFRLISTAKYYPLHLHLIRSLQHLIQHTHTYLNLTPFLLPIITTTLSPTTSSSSSQSKGATLRPLDMALHIRAPAQYLKTRVYTESTAEEALFLLGAWAECVQGSLAFPEVVFPSTIMLKKALKKSHSGGKNSGTGKITSQVKTLLERVEEGVKWVMAKRDNIVFAPSHQDEVERWEREVKVEDTPMGKWMRVQRKAREKKQALLDKVSASIPAVSFLSVEVTSTIS